MSLPSYTPKNLAPQEILQKAGFRLMLHEEKRGTGWELVYRKSRRLHAQLRLNEITLHKDILQGTKKHKVEGKAYLNERINKMIEKFEAIDLGLL